MRLADLGATNGTYVNGTRIVGPVDLSDGDEIRFGAAVFRFVAGAPARRKGSHIFTVIISIALVFAAAFAVTLLTCSTSAVFSRSRKCRPRLPLLRELLCDAAGPSASVPAAIGTAALEPPAPTALPDTAFHDSSSATDRLWLNPLNRYRESVGLAPVTVNPRFSHGDYLHSMYIVKNYYGRLAAGENLGVQMHFEDSSKPSYTVEGAAAGRAGDVDEMWNPRGNATPSWAIDNWMQSPFHRLPILNPGLHTVGYGYYCENPVCIAALNLNSDVDPLSSAPAPSAAPIEYPPDGATIDMNSFDGEWPDPLTSCPGYSLPAGYPITIQLGAMVNPGIARVSFKRTTPTPATLEACAFDGNTYSNPDSGTEKMARNQLISFGAIVIVPRTPLNRGTYAISLVAGGHDYSWSFSVER